MARTLLVVDDITTNREILKKMLGNEYEVLEATNGEEAVAVMRRQYKTLSAVLLDLAMPVMNGFEVLAQMRADAELTHLPVIVTTGKTEEESEVKALALGANDYITKPYNSAIIKQRIRNTINLRETAATVNALKRDKLTGLYNREVFFELAEEKIAAQEPGYYTMSAFNIDGFKVINDQYGSEMGDRVLAHVARWMKRWATPAGGLCCRVMADSFAVLYPSALAHSALLEKYHQELREPAFIDRAVNIRIGRYLVSDRSLSASAMYDRACLAEVSIKGKYDVSIAEYDEAMRLSLLREQEIVNEMKGALARKEFEVWLQPQVNHATGALIGAEGLVRWRHPQKGLIPPGEFIPVFERNGFIYELDKYVWERACQYLRQWTDAGEEPLPLSVNVSRQDLFHDDLVETVTGLTARYGVAAELLRLEITESAFTQSPEKIIDVVEKLMQKGFTVEIDDFGSGYSSLNTLKDVPASVLKLDMHFLENGRNSTRGGNIVESVVRMAKWLGMPVIAEGVETVKQADYLKSIGCYYVQGYLYAKPMPPEKYKAFALSLAKEKTMLGLETLQNLDNNALWDPNSMETLVFNSYVGGACIFEYHNGKTEMLRFNENYVKEVGGGELSSADVHALKLEQCMDGENRARLAASIRRAVEGDAESGCEVRLEGLRSSGASVHLRVVFRVIAKTGSRYLVYGSVFNMSALRESERKEREVSEQLLTIMDDIPGGFLRALVTPGGDIELCYVNAGFCELLGMPREEIVAIYGAHAPGGANARNRELLGKILEKARESDGRFQTACRLPRRDGGFVPVTASGRLTQAESGETYLNAYFTKCPEAEREPFSPF